MWVLATATETETVTRVLLWSLSCNSLAMSPALHRQLCAFLFFLFFCVLCFLAWLFIFGFVYLDDEFASSHTDKKKTRVYIEVVTRLSLVYSSPYFAILTNFLARTRNIWSVYIFLFFFLSWNMAPKNFLSAQQKDTLSPRQYILKSLNF